MSNNDNAVFINNTYYVFELILINVKTKERSYIDINKAGLEYLEITDTLANPGYLGRIKMTNFYKLLEDLQMFDADGTNTIYIGIKHLDENVEKDLVNTTMGFYASFCDGAEASKNSVEKSIDANIEEYSSARLRTETIPIQNELMNHQGSPGELLQKLIQFSNPIVAGVFDLNNEKRLSIKIADIYKPTCTSLNCLIMELSKYLTYENDKAGPGIIISENIIEDGILKRKMNVKPLADYITKFYEKLSQGNTDLKEYVTEEFTIGDHDHAPNLITNHIDNYNFIRLNQEEVLSSKWCDYILNTSKDFDIASCGAPVIRYNDVKDLYQKEMLKGFAANLPDRFDTDKINTKIVMQKQSDGSGELAKAAINNVMKKSFIYDNVAIKFTLPGNIYRKAGKFIRIISKTAPGGATDISAMGYWFVISVSHAFSGDFYTNTFICVRLHKDQKAESPVPAPGSGR